MSGKKSKSKLKAKAPEKGVEPVLSSCATKLESVSQDSKKKDVYIAWVNLSSSKRGVVYRPGDEVPDPEQDWIDFGMVIKKDFH